MRTDPPPDDPTAPRSQPGAKLIRVFSERVFLAHPVPAGGSLTIGRADDCDIVVNEQSVSRLHARLHFGDTVIIEDAGSSNGTRVAAVALGAGERCPLPPGQVAELGVVLVTIDGDEIAPAVPHRPCGPDAPSAAADCGVASGEVVVRDEAMVVLHRLIERVAGGDITVLLTGETGVGKEVLAEQIHRRSPRRDRPFLRLNCAALVEPLAESELFGHERGAFTGAARAKPGLFESAAGGTVFLDEIGEMPLALQAKLLRVLDERQVRPVGGLRPHAIDVRFVAATNRVLEDEITQGRFRQDLYFRLSGVTLKVPPLRQRPREIVALAELFAARAAAAMGIAPVQLSAAARAALARHVWLGNVRELKNVIERAILLGCGPEIGVTELGIDPAQARDRLHGPMIEPPAVPRFAAELVAGAGRTSDIGPTSGAAVVHGERSLSDQLDAVERQRILETLEACGGNQSEAARRLGMSRGTLIARLDRYGAPRPRRPAALGSS